MEPQPEETALKICQEVGMVTLFDYECNDGVALPLHVAKKLSLMQVELVLRIIELCSDSINSDRAKKFWMEVRLEIVKLKL